MTDIARVDIKPAFAERNIPLHASREEKIMDAYLREMKCASIRACGNLTLVSLCSEMREILQGNAIGRGRLVQVIPNSVNGEVFHRARREETRAWYAIAPDETVLFFAAQSLSEKRKGIAELFEALNLLAGKGRKFTVLCAGNGKPRCEPPPGVRVIIAGFVSDGATTILVSHFIRQVRELCNKILWIEKGHQVEITDDVRGCCDRYEQFQSGVVENLSARTQGKDVRGRC